MQKGLGNVGGSTVDFRYAAIWSEGHGLYAVRELVRLLPMRKSVVSVVESPHHRRGRQRQQGTVQRSLEISARRTTGHCRCTIADHLCKFFEQCALVFRLTGNGGRTTSSGGYRQCPWNTLVEWLEMADCRALLEFRYTGGVVCQVLCFCRIAGRGPQACNDGVGSTVIAGFAAC